MKAPYKRGAKLIYNGRLGTNIEVTYKKWWGFQRGALIVVQFQNGMETTVHVDEVRPK
jgi:hypothetical protein